jgi:hypothetical protein
MASPEAVRALERHMLQLPQVDLDTQHLVHGRMYARTILIPAGVVLTGALTNCDNICVMQGDISVTTDDGTIRLTGFHVIPARAGAKRAGMAHADTYWTMICHTDLTEVSAIEDEITDEASGLQTRRSALGHKPENFVQLAHDDFGQFCTENKITPELLVALANYNEDVIETENCYTLVHMGDSVIHGKGLFASEKIYEGVTIGPARISGKRCIAGRYTNHSAHPNAAMEMCGDDMVMVAMRDIDVGEEVTVSYRQVKSINNLFEGEQ